MPSASLQRWREERCAALDEIEGVHIAIAGGGRRYATQQLNYGYALLLCAQFQGYCRDLHSECAALMVQGILPIDRSKALWSALLRDRKLDRGNANAGNIGADYNLFGLAFWSDVKGLDLRNEARQELLEELNDWRNAIAHHDFTKIAVEPTLHLHHVRTWRAACHQLATGFDEVMRRRFETLYGTTPW